VKNISCWVFVLLTGLLIRSVLAAPPSDVAGPIRLLPGYHYHIHGFDSLAGEISRDKDNGPILSFDAPAYADSAGGGGAGLDQEINTLKSEDILWLKEQTVNGSLMRAVLTKDRRLLISFPAADAGFRGTVKNDEDVVDILLMVMTYHRPTSKIFPEPSKMVHKVPKLKRRT